MLTRRWSIWRRLAAVCGVAFFAWLLFQVWPVWLTPGPKTTVITGPLKPNGQVDYLAALNAEASVGVTPENNAVVLLVQALGPGVIDVSVRKRYFELLGVDMPPLELGGPYLQSFDEMFGGDLARVQRANDQMELARKKPWDDDEYPDIAAWLAVNEQPLQLCVQACERERFFSPFVSPDGSMVGFMPQLLAESRQISRLLDVRAMAHVQAGRIGEALADATTIHRLSRLVAQQGLMLNQLVAEALSGVGCATDARILQSAPLSREQARTQRELRAALPPLPEMIEILNHGERFWMLDTMQCLHLGPVLNVGWLQPNWLLQRVNQGIDEHVAALRVTDRASRQQAILGLSAKLKDSIKPTGKNVCRLMMMPRRQLVRGAADMMLVLYSPAGEQALIGEQRERQRQTLNILGFALAEYRAIHGNYPETIDALVPEILERVPLDTFGDSSLKYVVDGEQGTFRVYSVGENGVDDQGRFDTQIKADDLSFGTMPEE